MTKIIRGCLFGLFAVMALASSALACDHYCVQQVQQYYAQPVVERVIVRERVPVVQRQVQYVEVPNLRVVEREVQYQNVQRNVQKVVVRQNVRVQKQVVVQRNVQPNVQKIVVRRQGVLGGGLLRRGDINVNVGVR